MKNMDLRPNPDELLKQVKVEGTEKGKLKIFFGYAAGVGKTYTMLQDAHDQFDKGRDVVIGYIEPHTRKETMQLVNGLAVLPPKIIEYKNIFLKEFDLEEALKRKPQLILVDELAHSNVEGTRNKKRYQDIEELLNAGIDVYTTVNVQHIESLNDIIKNLIKVVVRETVPDYIFDLADRVELIDIEPVELLKRFEEGKVYKEDRIHTAFNNFFTENNLNMLREISMRRTAERIIKENEAKKSGKKNAGRKFMVILDRSNVSAKKIRSTARIAEGFRAPWIAVYVDNVKSDNESKTNNYITRNMLLAEQLGGQVVTLCGEDAALVVSEYAKESDITNIVIGKEINKNIFAKLFHEGLEDKLINLLEDKEFHIIPYTENKRAYKQRGKFNFKNTLELSTVDTIKMIITLCTASLFSGVIAKVELGGPNIAMIYILSVVIVSRITSGYLYGILSTIIGIIGVTYFFSSPSFSFIFSYIIMLVIALIISTLTIKAKMQAKVSAVREQRTQALYEINKNLITIRGLKGIVRFTNDCIVKTFNRSTIFYLKDPAKGNRGVLKCIEDEEKKRFLSEKEKAVASWVFVNKKSAGSGTDTLMNAGAYYIPLISHDKVLGVIGVSSDKMNLLTQENKIFLQAITTQVAIALESQYIADNQRKMVLEAEKEKRKSKVLR